MAGAAQRMVSTSNLTSFQSCLFSARLHGRAGNWAVTAVLKGTTSGIAPECLLRALPIPTGMEYREMPSEQQPRAAPASELWETPGDSLGIARPAASSGQGGTIRTQTRMNYGANCLLTLVQNKRERRRKCS